MKNIFWVFIFLFNTAHATSNYMHFEDLSKKILEHLRGTIKVPTGYIKKYTEGAWQEAYEEIMLESGIRSDMGHDVCKAQNALGHIHMMINFIHENIDTIQDHVLLWEMAKIEYLFFSYKKCNGKTSLKDERRFEKFISRVSNKLKI